MNTTGKFNILSLRVNKYFHHFKIPLAFHKVFKFILILSSFTALIPIHNHYSALLKDCYHLLGKSNLFWDKCRSGPEVRFGSEITRTRIPNTES